MYVNNRNGYEYFSTSGQYQAEYEFGKSCWCLFTLGKYILTYLFNADLVLLKSFKRLFNGVHHTFSAAAFEWQHFSCEYLLVLTSSSKALFGELSVLLMTFNGYTPPLMMGFELGHPLRRTIHQKKWRWVGDDSCNRFLW